MFTSISNSVHKLQFNDDEFENLVKYINFFYSKILNKKIDDTELEQLLSNQISLNSIITPITEAFLTNLKRDITVNDVKASANPMTIIRLQPAEIHQLGSVFDSWVDKKYWPEINFSIDRVELIWKNDIIGQIFDKINQTDAQFITHRDLGKKYSSPFNFALFPDKIIIWINSRQLKNYSSEIIGQSDIANIYPIVNSLLEQILIAFVKSDDILTSQIKKIFSN